MERRLAAVLAADAVGYARLVRHDEDATLAAISELRADFIEPLIAANRGRIFKQMGDGFLAEFPSAAEAVRCAVDWQRNIREHARPVRIVFRIGINLGDVVVDGDDMLGDGVNVASRLEGLSPAGGLCISDTVHEQVRDRMDIRFADGGEKRVKNIDRPLRVWTWQAGAAPRAPERKDAEDPRKPMTLSVVPFRNLSGDPEQAYFADGICEDVITGLSRNSALRVVARTVGTVDTSNAAFVLEGSVRRSGSRTRVAARLTDAGSGDRVWAEQFDSEMTDLFDLQDEIVAAIVHALGAADGVIEKSARQRSTGRSDGEGSAYDWYLKGRYHFYRHGDVGIDEAEACYLKALELEPEFAPACSALAWLLFIRFKLFRTSAFADIRPRAVELALRALELDREDFRAHWVLGGVYLHDGDHDSSVAEFDKALRINPNDANLLAWSAEALIYAGLPDKAIERCGRAMRINPNSPDWYHWIMGFALFHQGRYETALAALNRMSTPGPAGKLKAAVQAFLGKPDRASEEVAAYLRLVPNFRIAEWASTEWYADGAELDRYVEGLRRAGFPE